MVEIQGLQAFCKEAPEICHAYVSWLLIYLIFGTILTEMGQIRGFETFFLKTPDMKNDLKFGMLMYPDHLQNYLNCGDCWFS